MKSTIKGNANAYAIRASGPGWYVYYYDRVRNIWVQGFQPLPYFAACRAVREAKVTKG